MGLYFRQSIKVGPFRFNLSKSGFGMSAGVRGLRIGSGPRGHYIHAGYDGFYYLQRLGSVSKRHAPVQQTRQHDHGVQVHTHDGIQMLAFDSNSIDSMDADTSDGVLRDINRKASKVRLALILPLLFLMPAIIAFQALGSDPLLKAVPALVLVSIFLFGMWYDSFARATVLMYDFDEVTYATFGNVRHSFSQMMNAGCAWHLPSAGRVESLGQWKRNAGASVVVDRRSISLAMSLPPVVRSNIDVPTIPVGRQTLYFFPDRVLLRDGNRYKSFSYDSLNLKSEESRFIEAANVPSDAVQVGETWRYLNKNGSPDKRFNDNKLLPVCLYEDLLIENDEGICEIIQLSKVGPLSQFREALAGMKTMGSTSPELN